MCYGGGVGIDLHSLPHLHVPFTVVFFREESSTPFTGMPLMWDVPGVHGCGIRHFRLEFFVDCALHTIDLGVAQRLDGESMLCLLRNNVFDVPNTTMSC